MGGHWPMWTVQTLVADKTVLIVYTMQQTHFILRTWWWLTGVRQVRMLRLQLKETRAVKGTQWWRRKSLVYTAVQVEQCSGLTVWTVQVSSCDCDIPHFYTCTPKIHVQLLFYEHSRWPLSTVFCFALGHPILLRSWPPYSASLLATLFCFALGRPILLCSWPPYSASLLATLFCFACGHPILLRSWPPYSSSKWQCSSCVIIDVGTLLSLPMWNMFIVTCCWLCIIWSRPIDKHVTSDATLDCTFEWGRADNHSSEYCCKVLSD